jgi:hypothetical protein
VNPVFVVLGVSVGLSLAGLLLWALRGASQRRSYDRGPGALNKTPHHLNNMAQIRRAMDPADFDFVKGQGGRDLAARLRGERRKVVLLYLAAVRSDFEQSLRVARVIAVLSPEVSGSHEYERIRLAMIFRWRFQMIKVRLLMGIIPQPQFVTLWQMAASMAVQMEENMAKLGERAALAAELAMQSEK